MLDGLRSQVAKWIAPRAQGFDVFTSPEVAMGWLPSSASGKTVSPESAARAIPVQACVALIAGGIVAMPMRVLRREIVDGTFLQASADDHEYWWLFNESPNDDYSAAQFWERAVRSMLLYGAGYARIIRKGRSNIASEIVDVPPTAVTVIRDWDEGRRRLVTKGYAVDDGYRRLGVAPEDMLHFRGEQTPGENPRSSILEAAREAIGLTLAIEDYCGRIFSNGGMPKTVLSFPTGAKMTDAQVDALRKAWVERYGGTLNAALPLVLQQGGKAEKLSFTAEEAQMLEARKFQVIDIARAFRVPPFMIGETEKTSAWGTGIEQMSQGFIRYTLSRHMTAIEQEVTRKLFKTTRYFVDFDEEALTRGDMKSLGDWFRQAVGGSQGPGFLTVNEVRARINRSPVTGGDELYTPKGTDNAQEPTPGTDPAEPVDPEVVQSRKRRR